MEMLVHVPARAAGVVEVLHHDMLRAGGAEVRHGHRVVVFAALEEGDHPALGPLPLIRITHHLGGPGVGVRLGTEELAQGEDEEGGQKTTRGNAGAGS